MKNENDFSSQLGSGLGSLKLMNFTQKFNRSDQGLAEESRREIAESSERENPTSRKCKLIVNWVTPTGSGLAGLYEPFAL